jgi:hypothetical protein
MFASKGNNLCLADKFGNKIYLISGRNIIWQRDIEGEILNIAINKNGYISVSRTDTSHRTVVETYDSNGTKLFSTYLSASNVIDIAISNDNKFLAIAEANFSGIFIQSSIRIIPIEDARRHEGGAEVVLHTAPPGDLIINIEYNNRNDLVCIYDGYIDIIKNNEIEKLVHIEQNENILFADIKLNSDIAKIVRNNAPQDKNNIELHIINSSGGNRRKIYKIGNTPQSLHTNGNIIGVNLGTEVLFINRNGWLVKRYQSSHEIRDIVLSDNIAGIIYRNRIEIISL